MSRSSTTCRPGQIATDTTPAGDVADEYGPWAVDAALAVSGLSGAEAAIYAAIRARGLSSRWAVLGDSKIIAALGYVNGSDAPRRHRRDLVDKGWLLKLEEGGGRQGARYCPAVPNQSLKDAIEIGLLTPPNRSSGGEETNEYSPPDSMSGRGTSDIEGATPLQNVGGKSEYQIDIINLQSSSVADASCKSADDNEDLVNQTDKQSDLEKDLIDRLASALANKTVTNRRGYIRESARKAGLPTSEAALDRYEDAIQERKTSVSSSAAVEERDRIEGVKDAFNLLVTCDAAGSIRASRDEDIKPICQALNGVELSGDEGTRQTVILNQLYQTPELDTIKHSNLAACIARKSVKRTRERENV